MEGDVAAVRAVAKRLQILTVASREESRWNGSDLVRECIELPGASLLAVPIEELGPYGSISARVHLEPQ